MLRMVIFSVAYGVEDYDLYRKDGLRLWNDTEEIIVWETEPPAMVLQDPWYLPGVSLT